MNLRPIQRQHAAFEPEALAAGDQHDLDCGPLKVPKCCYKRVTDPDKGCAPPGPPSDLPVGPNQGESAHPCTGHRKQDVYTGT